MTNKDLLLKEVEEIPEGKLPDVIDFVRLLKSQRKRNKAESTLLSESSLAKDWLKPEEDIAWNDL